VTRPRLPLGFGLALAVLAAIGVSGRQSPVPPPVPAGQFKTGVEVVSLNVTVTNGGGRYVTDMNQGEFEVYEDGVKQDVMLFSRTSLPLEISLLVDTSASMNDKMSTVKTAASGFVARLRPEDRAQIINFDSRVSVLVPFTASHPDLDQAIDKLQAGGSTALYTALYVSLKELKTLQVKSADELNRQAIVMLTDGEDTSSLVGYDEVLEQSKRSETSVYAIALRAKDSNIGKGYSEADYVLRQFTSVTGGRVFFPLGVSELAGIYSQIWQELSSQYLIGYTSKSLKRDGRWRRVMVRARRPETAVRTRQGYYGPSG